MIVVIGIPRVRAGSPVVAGGVTAGIAIAAAARGARVELVGRVGDDAAGDALVLELARAGVGHVALLRDPARPTPTLPADEFEGDDTGDPGGPLPVGSPGTDAAAPGIELDAADVDLGLRYLTDYRVLVAAEPLAPDALAVVAEAARYASAHLVVVADPAAGDEPQVDGLVLAAPSADEAGAFATLVGSFTAAVDAGEAPGTAFAAAVRASGWEPAPDAEEPAG